MARAFQSVVLALALIAAACGDDDGVDLIEDAATTEATLAAGDTTAPPTTTPPETAATSSPSATTSSETTATAEASTAPEPEVAEFVIASPAFEDGGVIETEYSCDGANRSPALSWSGIPAGTVSLALVMNDPDAGGWVHWVAWNIPPDSAGFPEDVPAGTDLPDGTRQGTNDFAGGYAAGDPFPGGAAVKVVGYDGPCPPETHRYVFTLFALSGTIDLPGGTPAADIEAAIAEATLNGSMLDQAALTGEYTP